MKKYVSWVICGALVFSAWIVPNIGEKDIIAGANTGKGERVESVQDFGNILMSFAERTEIEQASSKSDLKSIIPLSNEEKESQKEYTSVTLSFETNTNINIKQTYNGTLYSSQVSMKRSMVCYYTETEAYYVVTADINTSSTEGYNNKKAAYSICEEVYVSEEKQLVKITYFTQKIRNTATDEEVEVEDDETFPVAALNKWLDLAEMGEMLSEVNDMNYEIMSILGSYILQTDTDKFIVSQNYYTLQSEEAKKLCVQLFKSANVTEEVFNTAEFSVNLSNSRSPSFNLIYAASDKSSQNYGENKLDSEIKEGEHITCKLSNINDTIVRFPENVTVYNIKDFM